MEKALLFGANTFLLNDCLSLVPSSCQGIRQQFHMQILDQLVRNKLPDHIIYASGSWQLEMFRSAVIQIRWQEKFL